MPDTTTPWRRAGFPPWARSAARYALTACMLAILWHVVSVDRVVALLREADVALLAGALLALLMQNVLSALRWRLTAGQLGIPLCASAALAEYFRAQAINMTLPGGVLGDASRAVNTRHARGIVAAGQAVVIDRALGQAALLSVLCVGLAAVAFGGEANAMAVVAASGVAAFAALLILAAIVLRRGSQHAEEWVRRASAILEPVRVSILAPKVWQRQLALSAVIVGVNILSVALCAAATGAPLPFVGVVFAVPVTLIAMVLPVSVAGWGVREGAAAMVWPLVGLSAEAGVAASAAYGFAALAAALPGFAVSPLPRAKG